MTARDNSAQGTWTTVLLTVALLAAFIFGVIVLAGGDLIPGTIIVVASVVGLGRELGAINRAAGR